MKSRFASVTHRLLAMKFMQEFIFIYPLYTLMFGDRGGVSASGIGIILALGFILTITLEIPTGVIADKIPRKYVLVSAIAIKTLAMATWLLVPNFTGYCVGIGLHSLANALESGALQAYLYGVLGDNSKKIFAKVWARVNAMVMISYTVAYIIATIVGPKYPALLIMSIGSCVIALLLAITLPVDVIDNEHTTERAKILGSAIKHILNSEALLKIILTAIIAIGLAEVTIEYIPLYFRQIGITIRYIPLLTALGGLIGAILFWTFHSWEEKFNRYLLPIFVISIGIFIASFTLSKNLAFICVGILGISRLLRVLQVQADSAIQHLSVDQTRATVASISNFAAKSLAALVVVLIGSLATNNVIVRPFRYSIIIGGVVYVILIIFNNLKNTKIAK